MKKVILITGTNSGFGWLHTHTLSEAGFTVYATMRDVAGKNKDKAVELSKLKNVRVVEVDLGSENSVNAVVGQIIAEQGQLDVLINNAGNFMGGIAETFNQKDIDTLFDIHFNATWRTIKAVLPQMRKQQQGLIVNTSSVLGRFSAPFMTFYNAAKFAVEGLSEGLHYEVRPLGVDVAIVQPGAFPTEIFGKSTYGSDSEIAVQYGKLADFPEQIGAGMGQLFENLQPNPQDVADAVLHLINTPSGKRPLRTVVDVATGQFAADANAQVFEGYKNFVSAFGLQELLN
ncbi:MAG: short-chain dehydrogenase/reductase [Flavobacterium sp. BFFFF1]|uniref:SDR family oxidoreductase n=1 Tax=Flavobacterium sp. BFFFF1 TaxID=2015557 RepID=UPI000BC9D464|nr:SDR family oxidoreductase [Flavobacterium sp. BFFFF1]OYU81095.1 MAG: short-chain dehydrogenase/reductase [Flavobacterium sp. BFFFF1]